MKTRNLTQSSLRNDPINRRMHGFSLHIFEDEVEVQDVITPQSLDQIPTKHSLDVEMSQERNEIEWHLNCGV